MELHLQPRADACSVSGRHFSEGDRVVSFLVRTETGEVIRHDLLESEAAEYQPGGFIACRWALVYKPRAKDENAERVLKLTAETLFLTLADPAALPSPENERLIRFLALMLERKRLLRPKGRSADRTRELYEHARTKQIFEVAAVDLDPDFFNAVQAQLSVLVGEPAVKSSASPEPSAQQDTPSPAAL